MPNRLLWQHWSPSSRRAWIEIIQAVLRVGSALVALLAEGVDRNWKSWTRFITRCTSPSSRRAWIEIGKAGRDLSRAAVALLAEGVDRNSPMNSFQCCQSKVALLAEGVDRNIAGAKGKPSAYVALLAEGVDRNLPHRTAMAESKASPSSRRAWIEIGWRMCPMTDKRVALLAEGVDRNDMQARDQAEPLGRPPRGGRG